MAAGSDKNIFVRQNYVSLRGECDVMTGFFLFLEKETLCFVTLIYTEVV
jgi:hypothetical protein